MRTTMVLDAFEMARWSRGNTLPGLTCHSDAGSQFTSIRYGERLAEIGAVPSIGTIGDSYDNALAETVNGYYKAELIYGPARTGPWKTIEDVELATLSWVYWHNTSRLHSYLGDVPPTEFEATFYDDQGPTNPWSQSNNPSLRQNQGDSITRLIRLAGWRPKSHMSWWSVPQTGVAPQTSSLASKISGSMQHPGQLDIRVNSIHS